MPDYSKSVIYKISCKDNNIDFVYIGSTTNFNRRVISHKYNVNRNIMKTLVYETIRSNGGWDNWEMALLHEYPCETSKDLRIEEERVRCEYNKSINQIRAFRTKEQQQQQWETNNRTYRMNNKEKMREYGRIYRMNNKEILREYGRIYRMNNKEKIRESKRAYYEKNKDN